MFTAPSPWIIGHRGAAGLAPENTLPSFQRAFDLGAHGIELDVYCVQDQLLVCHDDNLERTTSGEGRVQTASVDYLRSLDAGAGAQIPLLHEVLQITPKSVLVNIELKGANTGAAVALAQLAHPRILVSSFRPAELLAFRLIDATTPTATLLHRWPPAPWHRAAQIDAWAINLSVAIASAKRVKKIKQRGYRCLVYTVNKVSVAQRLFDLGVDGVFTDRPDLLMPLAG